MYVCIYIYMYSRTDVLTCLNCSISRNCRYLILDLRVFSGSVDSVPLVRVELQPFPGDITSF